jgi:tRNA G46 methylase TrmB
MRKLKDTEIIFVVYGILTLILGTLVFQYRSALQQGPPGIQEFANRNIEFVTDFYGLRYRGISNNYIDVHVLYYGAFEKPMLHWLRDTVALLADEDLVFLDVGANTGQHTLFMSRLVSEVHAFEPYPPVLEKLRGAIDRNQLANVSVHAVA